MIVIDILWYFQILFD